MDIKVLYIGDVVGRPGRQVLAEELMRVVREQDIDCVIANVENVAGGSGLTVVTVHRVRIISRAKRMRPKLSWMWGAR